MTPQQEQALLAGLAIVQTIGPELGANGAIAAAIVSAAAAVVQTASNDGTDVTDEQLQAIFDKFELNKADDLSAQADAKKKGDTTGG